MIGSPKFHPCSDRFNKSCSKTLSINYFGIKFQIEKRSKLGESQTLQQFSRDADEIENWMLEKLQLAGKIINSANWIIKGTN